MQTTYRCSHIITPSLLLFFLFLSSLLTSPFFFFFKQPVTWKQAKKLKDKKLQEHSYLNLKSICNVQKYIFLMGINAGVLIHLNSLGFSTPPQCRREGIWRKPPPTFFLHFSLPFYCFLLLKETETKGFWSGYSLYIQHCTLFEEAPSQIPAGGTERQRRRKNARRALYNGLRCIQTNQKGKGGLLLWSWQLCSLKWGMMLQPDGVRLDTGDTQFAGVHICVEKHTHNVSLFLLLQTHLEKHRQRERWEN